MIAAAFLLAAHAVASTPPKIVSLKTSDGWTLVADYRAPAPHSIVVVLAHGVASSRGEWTALAERLKAAGIGTLAIDLRGHHDSAKGPAGARDFSDFDATHEWPKAVEDFAAGTRWLKSRGIDERRIAFGGASIGANLAAAAASKNLSAPFLLLLSPGPDYRGVGLQLRRGLKTLAGASAPDAYAHQTLAPLSKIEGVEIFEAPSGHGTQMFNDAATLNKVVAWIVAASTSQLKTSIDLVPRSPREKP